MLEDQPVTAKRLFVGVMTMRKESPSITNVGTETFVGWFDITDIARNPDA